MTDPAYSAQVAAIEVARRIVDVGCGMTDPRKIEAAIVEYLRREGVEVNDANGTFMASDGNVVDIEDDGGDEFGALSLQSIDTLRLAEAIADALR